MKRLALGLAITAWALAACTPAPSPVPSAPEPPPSTLQSQDSFDASFHNVSMPPRYVAVRIVDDRTGAWRDDCVIADRLAQAFNRERASLLVRFSSRNDADENDPRWLLAVRTHVFHFRRADVLADLPEAFTPAQVGAIRARLMGLSKAQLRDGFNRDGALHVDASGTQGSFDQLRDATACVLFEHGLSSLQDDMGANIRVAD